MNNKTKGYLYGAVAAATYGMNPLFALPLYADGMNADSVLFFRYLLALAILGGMIKWRGRDFRVRIREVLPLAAIGMLMACSSLTLFLSYNYMAAGIASTMLFVYPILVALIMAVCFREKVTILTAACIALALLFAINAIQAIGDLTATTVGGLNREPTDQELQGGIVTYGLTNVLSAFFGSLPTATYSQNVGIVTTNKVVNRVVFALAGGFLLLAGLIPKFSAILTTIPQCVLGGAPITVFSTIAMTGMKLIASETISPRNTTIVGLSAALGVGISQSSSALSQFPESITIIFGKTPVVIATIMAVLLNLILPQENKDQ